MARNMPTPARWILLMALLSAGTGVFLWKLRGGNNGTEMSPAEAASTPSEWISAAASSPGPLQERRSEVELFGNQDSHRQERRAVAARFLEKGLPDPERQSLALKAVQLNERLLLRFPDHADIEKYVVRRGDSLAGIARKFTQLRGGTGAILLLNGLKETAVLHPGQQLKVSRGLWSILVDKTLFCLYLCYKDAPFKSYAIAVGANGKTPAAEFTVDAKNPKPMWWPPRALGIRAPVKYGDPQNPLGEWWIGLEHRSHHGFGIHGTNDPGSIGTQASLGCVRMRNEDVAEIAAIAYRGMVVRIVD